MQKSAQRRVDTVQRTVQHTTQRCYSREILLFQKLVSCPFKKVNGFSCPRPRNITALRGGLHCALHSSAPCGEQRLISRLLDIVRLMCRQRDLVQFSRRPFQGSIYDRKLTLNARPLART